MTHKIRVIQIKFRSFNIDVFLRLEIKKAGWKAIFVGFDTVDCGSLATLILLQIFINRTILCMILTAK